MMANGSAFDASRYLTKLKGKDYLEVKWRLLWLRTEHPEATIATELHTLGEGLAVFKATVALASGASATGWGSETAADFGDWLEKAETKAIGRALAALGYGTQFCEDHVFGADAGHVVDSPVQRPPVVTAAPAPAPVPPVATASMGSTPKPAPKTAPPDMITTAQVRFAYKLGWGKGLDEKAVDDLAMQEHGAITPFLSRREASALIDRLQQKEATR